MLSVLRVARKSLGHLAAVAVALVLASCTEPGTPAVSGPAIDTSDPVPVALLVPGGSGQPGDELLARSLENAARLAIADLGGVQIDLRVYNTAGSPTNAAAMATQAVADGARIILGPVFAQEANAAGLAVAASGVNVLAFSNNTDIAGGNVFVLGPTFDNTAGRLASYAVRQGRGQVMIIQDQSTAGDLGRAAIERGVAAAGGSVVAVGSYEFSQNGVVSAAPGLVAEAKSSGASSVFLTADAAGALPLITQMLSESGLDPAATRYIGLTRWDSLSGTMDLPGLQGGWFALPDPGLYQTYRARYQAVYGEEPHPISGLAYDGIAAIGALVRQGNAQALSITSLTQGAGFVGVNGIFRLRADGTNQRGLAVAQVQNRQLVIVDPAPRNFSGAGF